MGNALLNFCPFNCIAVQREQQIAQFFRHFDPPLAFFLAVNCQLERRLALRPAPYSPARQNKRQRRVCNCTAPGTPTHRQQDAKGCKPRWQTDTPLAWPKTSGNTSPSRQIGTELLDRISHVPAPIVAAPDREHTPTGSRLVTKRLKPIARHLRQFLAPLASGRSRSSGAAE